MKASQAPLDGSATNALAEQGLRFDLVDTSDREAFSAWLNVEMRGFHGDVIAEKQREKLLEEVAYRRTTGVWDDTAAEPENPVATLSSWRTPMSVPGERSIESWAISSVTVSPTHRRRGIARNLLEAELRTAHAEGAPLAILTVSEATIYARYGFGPVTMAHDLTISTQRTRWIGPEASGRVHFVSLESIYESCRNLHEQVRLKFPGEIRLDDALWGDLVGLRGSKADENVKKLRAVRYDDASGAPQGFVIYGVTEPEGEFTGHTSTVSYLLAATEDAYAGLWHFLLELDLVSTISAPLRSVDEPVVWQVSNQRAVRDTQRQSDHLWGRILDVKESLEARHYESSGTLVLDVLDPLDIAGGRYLVTINDRGEASVTQSHTAETQSAPATDAAGLRLGIAELSSLYLGTVSARTLLGAGRIIEQSAGSADAFDTCFRSPTAPWLSVWF